MNYDPDAYYLYEDSGHTYYTSDDHGWNYAPETEFFWRIGDESNENFWRLDVSARRFVAVRP